MTSWMNQKQYKMAIEDYIIKICQILRFNVVAVKFYIQINHNHINMTLYFRLLYRLKYAYNKDHVILRKQKCSQNSSNKPFEYIRVTTQVIINDPGPL